MSSPIDIERLAEILKSAHPNEMAKESAVRAITREWLRKVPLIYIWGPSGEGKTSLLGGLLRHPDYRPTLFIDVEQGEETIAKLTTEDAFCELRRFDQEAKKQLPWLFSELRDAADSDCAAVVVEGVAGMGRAIRGRAIEGAPTATGRALQQLSIESAMRTESAIGAIRDAKMNRVAKGKSGPIIVTLTTREIGVDEAVSEVPDLSRNGCKHMRSTADALLQLQRRDDTTYVIANANQSAPHAKLRNRSVADAVETCTNLSLPGLCSLWALTVYVENAQIKQPKTPVPAPTA